MRIRYKNLDIETIVKIINKSKYKNYKIFKTKGVYRKRTKFSRCYV